MRLLWGYNHQFFYQPITKLGEVNIFIRVCLSLQRGKKGVLVNITHDALLLTVQDPPAPSRTWDLTVQGLLGLSPPPPMDMRPHRAVIDIWWRLLKRSQSPPAGDTHPTGILSC